MSDIFDTSPRGSRLRRMFGRRRTWGDDSGMTLPEVVISVAITGIVIATMSTATTVILRQMDNTEGRTNNARSEQNVSLFMPTDLSSAESVDTTAQALPCGPTPVCPATAEVGGSNALMLTWSGTTVIAGVAVPTETKVSYRVIQVTDEFRMIRVECYTVKSASPTTTCQTKIVLRDLEHPPDGVNWIPGTTPPSWVMTVSQAAAPDDISGPDVTAPAADPGYKNKNAQRVVVTINGGGDAAGAGGGRNQISLSAGGTNRETNLTTDDLAGAPSFTAARSRCGGNFGLVIDKSGSIGSANMTTVRNGLIGTVVSGQPVPGLIDRFDGTPVKIQAVAFSDTASVLGGRYYDMLVPADVADLKSKVNALTSGGSTNWEDGFFKMLKNADGTVQGQLPNTILFFTDGVPTRSRMESASQPLDPLDAGLSVGGGGSDFYQVGWNRTERLIRDRGSIKIIGVYVNSSTSAHSDWTVAGEGYHVGYERSDAVYYQQGTTIYQRGNNVTYERGSHPTYERGNTVVYERGYHNAYQRNNNVVLAYAASGMAWEKWNGTKWVAASGGSVTSSSARTAYFNNNSSPGEGDGWRARVTSVPTGSTTWTTLTDPTQYAESNLSTGTADGFRATVGTLSSNWTTVTEAEYTSTNTTSTESDGYRINTGVADYTAPFALWSSTTSGTYDSNNSTTDETDGWRTRTTATPTTWTAVTQAQYDDSNTTADSTDGWRTSSVNTSPYSAWTATTKAAYEAVGANTTSAETDGWRTQEAVPSTSWTTVTAAEYNLSNTTSDNSDGWQTSITWANTTQALYEANNTSNAETDLWRTQVSGSNTTWTEVTQTLYNTSNTNSTETDGWRTGKIYAAPFSSHDLTTTNILDYSTIGNLVIDDTSGANPGQYTPAVREVGAATPFDFSDDGGEYTNAAEANLFVLPSYAQFGSALASVALDQCGGTVTLQTKIGSAPAQDPFTYENTATNEVVHTSALYRSGTFDVDLKGGASATVTISPQDFTNLTHYAPAGWTCKSAGADYPFTVVPVAGHAPWTAIQMTVSPNKAVSCIQQVTPS